tara:strand:+ start:8 stop:1261 length:1254 start_codon:yes stop_codon:yes gene_type:complete
MNFKGFNYKNNNLFCEHVSLEDISFEFGTPIYVYSGESIEDAYSQLSSSISDTNTEINFALKANSTLGILSLLSKLGAGADIVSGGELVKALHAKINPQKIVFSGVGKTTEEIKLAIKNGIKQINAESYSEIENIISIADELNTKVPVAIRVNPNISVKTHEKIATGSNDTKFGMPIEETANIYKRLSSEKNIKTMGLAIHIGSQIFDMNEFKLAYLNILSVANSLRQEGFKVPNLDLGGGLGVDYKIAKINFFDYGKIISDVFKGYDYSLSVEPGRSLVANSGILLTKVIYLKKTMSKNFIIVDGAMNDFIRPTLYNAHHNVEPVNLSKSGLKKFDIVGPICETGDYFAKDALLSNPTEGQLLAIFSTGAYGSVMSSMYNSRVPANEILVHNGKVHKLKEQERIEDLINKEILPKF